MIVDTISSGLDLTRTIEQNQDGVVTFLCEDAQDIKALSELLTNENVNFSIYCPHPPYNHGPEILIDFYENIENEKKGNQH